MICLSSGVSHAMVSYHNLADVASTHAQLAPFDLHVVQV